MSATTSHKSLHELSPVQIQAIGVLSSGGTQSEAAKNCGVHRVTITRWANHHPAFVAELSHLREEQFEKHAAAARRVTEKAIKQVELAIDQEDVDVALRWLRLSLPQAQPGQVPRPPTDPKEIVEAHRSAMPSGLDKLLESSGGRPTVSDAERDLKARIE